MAQWLSFLKTRSIYKSTHKSMQVWLDPVGAWLYTAHHAEGLNPAKGLDKE